MASDPGDPFAAADARPAGISSCPGCGVVLPVLDGPGHPYLTGSPACWATFGRLLAGQYEDPGRMQFHQLVVDAYAVQHPGSGTDRRAVQSVGIHLMTLCLFLEQGTDPALGAGLHRRMTERPTFRPLSAPADRGGLTCADVPVDGPADRVRPAVDAWARSAWTAWSAHHDTVRQWLAVAGLGTGRP